MQRLTERGIRLARKLREEGLEVIESYPGAAQDMLGISRKGKGLELLLDGLSSFGVVFPDESKKNHDELDAITSALVGYFYLTHQYIGLGLPEESELIVPRIPKFQENSHSIVIGLAGLSAAGKTTIGNYLSFHFGFRYARYSLLLKQLLDEMKPRRKNANLQDFGLEIHRSMGPEGLTKRLIRTLAENENWVVDGLRHVGDFETLNEHFKGEFHLIYVEASEKQRQKRIKSDPLSDFRSPHIDDHEVDKDIPLLSFKAFLRIENNKSFKQLFGEVDKILGL